MSPPPNCATPKSHSPSKSPFCFPDWWIIRTWPLTNRQLPNSGTWSTTTSCCTWPTFLTWTRRRLPKGTSGCYLSSQTICSLKSAKVSNSATTFQCCPTRWLLLCLSISKARRLRSVQTNFSSWVLQLILCSLQF